MRRRKLRNREACGKKFDSRLRVHFYGCVQTANVVGAPTKQVTAKRSRYARQGNGSHYSENLSLGRGRPPGQLSGAHVWAAARSGVGRAPREKSLRLDVGSAFARSVVVCGTRDARSGAYSAVRAVGVVSQGAERLRAKHRAGDNQ